MLALRNARLVEMNTANTGTAVKSEWGCHLDRALMAASVTGSRPASPAALAQHSLPLRLLGRRRARRADLHGWKSHTIDFSGRAGSKRERISSAVSGRDGRTRAA